jgi:hypothetical protein
VAYPYRSEGARIRLIRDASPKRRRELRDTLLSRFRQHLKSLPKKAKDRWPPDFPTFHLAVSLDPDEVFPADVLAEMAPKHFWYAFQDIGHMPIDFPEPELEQWLLAHMEKHIKRAIAGKEELESMEWIWVNDIVSPAWSTSSVLTILAYEMAGGPNTYDRIKNTPSLSAHFDAIPPMVHERDDRGDHPNPRAAAKALWEAAQAARKSRD